LQDAFSAVCSPGEKLPLSLPNLVGPECQVLVSCLGAPFKFIFFLALEANLWCLYSDPTSQGSTLLQVSTALNSSQSFGSSAVDSTTPSIPHSFIRSWVSLRDKTDSSLVGDCSVVSNRNYNIRLWIPFIL
jgi:hypothetical protein